MAEGEDIREPQVQMVDEDDGVRLIVELPGVAQDSIKMGVSGDVLKLDADGKRGKFSTVQVIPFEPDPERIAVTFSQGVLDIDLKKKHDPEDDGKKVDSELSISIVSMEKELDRLKEQLQVVSEEKGSLEERLHFLQRDFQNIKRRHETEKESIADRKIIDMAQGLIDVLDSFGFAKKQISSGSRDKGVDNTLKGVEMIENQVMNLFTRLGIKTLATKGACFDPNFHEAVGYVENRELDDEVVAEEVKTGYVYKETTIRPAQVLVNRKPVEKKRSRSKKKN
jgi:molecular chaperone GrpE